MKLRNLLLTLLVVAGFLAYAHSVSVNTTLSGGISPIDPVSTSSVTATTMLRMPTNAAPQANVIPAFVGQIIINTGATPDEICFSTAAVVQSWVLVSTPTATCSN